MKKLRMIVTSVIVLAIVGSAFSFKAKTGRFCILTTDPGSGTDCTTFTLANQKITTVTLGSTQWKYAPCWDQDNVKCTASGNGLCTATFRLTID